MAPQCDSLLTGQRGAAVCLCVYVWTGHMWAILMSTANSIWAIFYTKEVQEKSIRCPTSRCGLITLTDSSANQQRAHRNAHPCVLTNGIRRNCLQMSKLMDTSIDISCGEMSRLTGKILKMHFAVRGAIEKVRWYYQTNKCLLNFFKVTDAQLQTTIQ